MKQRAMPCRATQDRQAMVESSDKMWSTREGNGKSLQHSYLENRRNSIKKQKETTPEDEPSQIDRCQYATGEEQRNSSRRNEETKPKSK